MVGNRRVGDPVHKGFTYPERAQVVVISERLTKHQTIFNFVFSTHLTLPYLMSKGSFQNEIKQHFGHMPNRGAGVG